MFWSRVATPYVLSLKAFRLSIRTVCSAILNFNPFYCRVPRDPRNTNFKSSFPLKSSLQHMSEQAGATTENLLADLCPRPLGLGTKKARFL